MMGLAGAAGWAAAADASQRRTKKAEQIFMVRGSVTRD
jgi:hypothetical protein